MKIMKSIEFSEQLPVVSLLSIDRREVLRGVVQEHATVEDRYCVQYGTVPSSYVSPERSPDTYAILRSGAT
jgi:hypothetical protein